MCINTGGIVNDELEKNEKKNQINTSTLVICEKNYQNVNLFQIKIPKRNFQPNRNVFFLNLQEMKHM
jgi:hypothetical protein